MWARISEMLLALWLAASEWIFGSPQGARSLLGMDALAAALIILFALASYWRPTRYAHLASVIVAAWLVGYGWTSSEFPASPADQNRILTGLVLLMLAIVPSHASEPPEAWRRQLSDR